MWRIAYVGAVRHAGDRDILSIAEAAQLAHAAAARIGARVPEPQRTVLRTGGEAGRAVWVDGQREHAGGVALEPTGADF
jgi:hypothetical protein